MAEIKKIKVDGVEYDIGSNLGAELEWKLVATGTYDSSKSNDNTIEYILDKKLEEDKLYYIERYDDIYGSFYHCFYKRSYDCYIRATDKETEETCEVYLDSLDYNSEYYSMRLISNTPIYHGESDTLEVYELAIKNVENPVVTPNKLNLYTTGTYDEKSTLTVHYKLEKPLQPNKLYYVERYDANMAKYFNCVIRTDNNAQSKCTTRMFACEDDGDTIIFVNVYLSPGEGNTVQEFLIGGEHSIYQDPEDTLEIYELPFEF